MWKNVCENTLQIPVYIKMQARAMRFSSAEKSGTTEQMSGLGTDDQKSARTHKQPWNHQAQKFLKNKPLLTLQDCDEIKAAVFFRENTSQSS